MLRLNHPQYRKLLLGQHIGLDESYLKPTEQQLLQKYAKVIDSITINNEHRLQVKVVELTEKQTDIELLRLEQRQKDKQIEQLRSEFEEFKVMAKQVLDVRAKVIGNMALLHSTETEQDRRIERGYAREFSMKSEEIQQANKVGDKAKSERLSKEAKQAFKNMSEHMTMRIKKKE